MSIVSNNALTTTLCDGIDRVGDSLANLFVEWHEIEGVDPVGYKYSVACNVKVLIYDAATLALIAGVASAIFAVIAGTFGSWHLLGLGALLIGHSAADQASSFAWISSRPWVDKLVSAVAPITETTSAIATGAKKLLFPAPALAIGNFVILKGWFALPQPVSKVDKQKSLVGWARAKVGL